MQQTISINGRLVGLGHPAYIIAEISGNHNGDLARAKRLVRIAAEVHSFPLSFYCFIL